MTTTNEILHQLRQQMPAIELEITEARRLIGMLEQAGEDTTDLRRQLSELEQRKRRWQVVLNQHQ